MKNAQPVAIKVSLRATHDYSYRISCSFSSTDLAEFCFGIATCGLSQGSNHHESISSWSYRSTSRRLFPSRSTTSISTSRIHGTRRSSELSPTFKTEQRSRSMSIVLRRLSRYRSTDSGWCLLPWTTLLRASVRKPFRDGLILMDLPFLGI